jgi:hypothetical protein
MTRQDSDRATSLRAGDNAPGMRMTAAAILFEIAGAYPDFALCRRIEHFKPRQRQGRYDGCSCRQSKLPAYCLELPRLARHFRSLG